MVFKKATKVQFMEVRASGFNGIFCIYDLHLQSYSPLRRGRELG